MDRAKGERQTHLSLWPIVLLKNVVIHFRGTVGHKHYCLAAHAATASSIKLREDRQDMKIQNGKQIISEMLFSLIPTMSASHCM